MNLRNIFILFLMLTLTNGCKIECPPFDESLLTWVPYEMGDTLQYVNQHKDTLKFSVVTHDVSDSYKIEKCGKCSCEAHAEIGSEGINELSNYSLGIEMVSSEKSISFDIGLRIGNARGILGFTTSNLSDLIIDTLIVDNKIYKDVLVIKSDTVLYPKRDIWKVIMVKNYGIIKFYNRATGYEWTLN